MKDTTTTYKFIPLLLSFLVFVASTGIVNAFSSCHCYEQENVLEEKTNSCCKRNALPIKHLCCEASPINTKKNCGLNTKSFSKNCCGGNKLLIEKLEIVPIVKVDLFPKFIPLFLNKQTRFLSNKSFRQNRINKTSYQYYKSPLLYKDIPILIQSFLL